MTLDNKLKDVYSSMKEKFQKAPETETKNMYKSQKGFTYYDLAVVGALIGIIAAIAVPNLKQAVNMGDVKRHGRDIRVLSSAAEQYATEDDTPTFSEFDAWMLDEQKRSVHDFDEVGIAFMEPTSYNNFYLENKDMHTNNPTYVVACRGHEHPDVKMLDDFYSQQQQKEGPKVRKLYSVNNKTLEVLAKGDNDWFSEIIEENYK